MKSQEKREFKSSSLLTLVGLLGLSGIIIATPWNRSAQDISSENALQKAEVVGYQVVQIYREASRSAALSLDKNSDSRMPASAAPTEGLRETGTMGIDPWGQPYHYRILSDSKSPKTRILVWSSGPDKKVQTAELGDENKPVHGQPSFVGDDLGLVLSVSQN